MVPRREKAIKTFDGFAMRLKCEKKDGTQLFYCVERERRAQCMAKYEVNPFNKSFSVITDHSRHDRDESRADSYVMRQELKRCASDGTPREVIDQVRVNHSPVVSMLCGSYDAKRRLIYRARGKQSLETVEMNRGGPVAPEFQVTTSGDAFLISDENDGSSRIMIFASDKGLELLSCSTIVLVDGTFDVTPHGFTQMFSFHSYIADNVIRPLVFCLLTDKKLDTYKQMIETIRNQPRLANWEPSLVICDYEVAIKTAFVFHFPNVAVEGCLFHLIQSWRKQAEKLKIYEEFISGSILDFWARLKSIPFIDSNESQSYYNELLLTLPPNGSSQFDDFLGYIERNYMTSTSRFPPEMWSCHFRTINSVHRTTNCLEVWHRTIEKIVSEKNGMSTVKISDLIQKLRLEERHTSLDAAELRINPNFSVNKKRKFKNLLKDRTLLKVLENNPPPPNLPLDGIQFLDAITFASNV